MKNELLADGVEYVKGMKVWSKAEIQDSAFSIGQFTYLGNGFLCYKKPREITYDLSENQPKRCYFSTEKAAQTDFIEQLKVYADVINNLINSINTGA